VSTLVQKVFTYVTSEQQATTSLQDAHQSAEKKPHASHALQPCASCSVAGLLRICFWRNRSAPRNDSYDGGGATGAQQRCTIPVSHVAYIIMFITLDASPI
jgi:hypothetical protein